jgi:hypothetical protein
VSDEPDLFDLMVIAFEVASKRSLQDDRERLGSIAVIE